MTDVHLTIGLDENSEPVSIHDVASGKTKLHCPFCAGPLLAKKGHVLQHHFAHLGDTCHGALTSESLPAFDDFNLRLAAKELEELRGLWESSQQGKYAVPAVTPRLSAMGLFKDNPFRAGGQWEFTHRGKIPVRGLSLNLFGQLHPLLLLEPHETLQIAAAQEPGNTQIQAALLVYRAQLRRLYSTHLYCLQVDADGERLYKIGLTSRQLEDRLPEIHRDLAAHFETVKIKPLLFKLHRGHCERYFKFLYAENNRPVGRLTEYFTFSDVEFKKVLSDLKRMPDRQFNDIETKIQRNWWAKEERRISAVRRGVALAKANGQRLGRPKGSTEDVQTYLAKPANAKIVQLLKAGQTVRAAAVTAGASTRTVQRVKRALATLLDEPDS